MPTLPSGEQIELRHARYRAVVTEVGAALRVLEHDGRPLVRAFAETGIMPVHSGAVLAPWPNRIAGGRYCRDGLACTLWPAPYGCSIHPYLVGGTGKVDPERLLPTGERETAGSAFDFRAGRPRGATAIDHAFGGVDFGRSGEARAVASDAVGRGVLIAWDRSGRRPSTTAEFADALTLGADDETPHFRSQGTAQGWRRRRGRGRGRGRPPRHGHRHRRAAGRR